MEAIGDNLLKRLHQLISRQLDDSIDAMEHSELSSLLMENPAARRAYVEYFQETACLRWLCLEEMSAEIDSSGAEPRLRERSSKYRRWLTWFGGAACLLALAGAALFFGSSNFVKRVSSTSAEQVATTETSPIEPANPIPVVEPVVLGASSEQVATLTGLGASRWATSMPAVRPLSRWGVGDRLQFEDGAIELTFDCGAQVTIFGPADLEITSPMSIRCEKGRVTTLVGDRGKGFVIQTPRAKVVDLGTQFGLSISDKGETEVVVFQGSVDLSYDPPADELDDTDKPLRRLQQGEALLLKNSGEFQRIVAVQRNDFLTALDAIRRRSPERVIADIRDNIQTSEGVMSYQIVHHGLEDDVPSFVDRNHQWNGIDESGIPSFLLGADYVMPFNHHKFVHTLELELDLLRPAYVYVFLDNNMEVPEWVRKDFQDTGVDIGLDGSKTEWHLHHSLGVGPGVSVDFPFSVWRRHVKEAGTIKLGSVSPPKGRPRSSGFNMYGIAAVAAD